MLIRLLGRVGLTHAAGAEQVEIEPSGQLRKGLLAVLALRAGQPVPIERLIDTLWATTPPRGATNSVQAHVSALRRVLPPDLRVLATQRGYVLEATPDAVDALRAEQLVEQARRSRDPAGTLAFVQEALDLWRGPALADVRGLPALAVHADRLDTLHLEALSAMVTARLALGESTELIPELHQLVAEHPFDEALHAALMTALYRAGRQADALAAFRTLQTLLADELGIAPGRVVSELHQAMLRQDDSLLLPTSTDRKPQAPAATLAPRRLPTPLSSFVGRQHEMAQLRELLSTERLVTVLGAGGTGKTRLALETAPLAVPAGDLVAVAQLADLPAAGPDAGAEERVAAEIAAALGLVSEPGQPLLHTLTAALADRSMLLVVDNAEHVRAAASAVVGELLQAAPHLRVVVTSREPLGIPGEHCLAVSPLPLPAHDAAADTATIAASPAVQLLVERASARDPTFAIREGNAADLAQLCRRLDGLPLALELIAPRLLVLPPADLARSLEAGTGLVSTTATALPQRHRSLEDAVRWSHDLLDEDERAALRSFAAFTDGAGVEALTQVCRPDAPVLASVPVLSLVDKSLLFRDPAPGPARVRAHSAIASFAREQLRTAGDERLARRRHAQLFRDVLRHRGQPGSPGPDVRVLAPEAANIETALRWSADNDLALAIQIGAAGWWFWYRTDHVDEPRRLLDSVLDRPKAAQAPDYGAALAAAGYLAWLKDDFAAATVLAERALAGAGETDAVRAMALGVVSRAAGDRGDFAQALDAALESIARYEAAGDRWGAVWSRRCAAVAVLYLDDVEGASTEARRCLDEYTELGDTWGIAGSLDMLAAIALRAGDHDRAVQWAAQAVDSHRDLGDHSGLRYALQHRAEIAAAADDVAMARELARESLTIAREHGYRVGAMQALLLLARYDDRAAAEEAIALARALGDSDAEDRAIALLT